MVKVFMVRIETTHFVETTDIETKWEETKNELKRAAREYFFEPDVTVDEIGVVSK